MLLEVRAARTVHFWENFIKQKLKSAPDLVGAGQVRSSPGPHPGVRQPVHVQGEGLAAVVIKPIELKLGRCFTPM